VDSAIEEILRDARNVGHGPDLDHHQWEGLILTNDFKTHLTNFAFDVSNQTVQPFDANLSFALQDV
jgi:hypothetical protein